MNIAYSKITSKSQTVIPSAVRERLDVKPGDKLRYEIRDDSIVISKAKPAGEDDPFAVFTEWSSDADEEAFGTL